MEPDPAAGVAGGWDAAAKIQRSPARCLLRQRWAEVVRARATLVGGWSGGWTRKLGWVRRRWGAVRGRKVEGSGANWKGRRRGHGVGAWEVVGSGCAAVGWDVVGGDGVAAGGEGGAP